MLRVQGIKHFMIHLIYPVWTHKKKSPYKLNLAFETLTGGKFSHKKSLIFGNKVWKLKNYDNTLASFDSFLLYICYGEQN